MKYSKKFIENSLIFMEIASSVAKFSKAQRKQVGSVIVSAEGKIIGTGFNGTPSKVHNSCENEDGETHPFVLHSELNAIFNATTHALEDSTIYITYSPCIHCASAIIQKKIKTVIYDEPYRDMSGVEFLNFHGIEVISLLELKSLQDSYNEMNRFKSVSIDEDIYQ